MQCNKCGSILAEGATFCPNCGAPVEQNLENNNPNNLNNGISSNTTNSQGNAPDLMAQMFNQTPNDVQPEIQKNMNNAQPNMVDQTVTNSSPNLMSSMPNTNQSNMQSEMSNNMNNAQPNMNSQQQNPFLNAQPFQPINQMSQGQMASPEMKKSNNKKTFVIGGIVVAILVIVIVYFMFFSNNGTIVNMEGVNVWVPNDYTEETQYGYDKVYMSKDKDMIIGLITQSASGITLDQYMEVLDSGQGLGSIECEKGTKQTIKGQEWAHYSCSSNSQKSNMYVTIKDSELYMVEIGAKKNSANKINSIEKKIEQNLEITN